MSTHFAQHPEFFAGRLFSACVAVSSVMWIVDASLFTLSNRTIHSNTPVANAGQVATMDEVWRCEVNNVDTITITINYIPIV
jgi:hypothetical protein